MNRGVVVLVVGFLVLAMSASAQEKISTTRIERQHKLTRFQRGHMKDSEESLRAAIESPRVELQETGIQAVRDLEQLDTHYKFTLLISPLSEKLKDLNASENVRMLAALALDELHSDVGDAAIQSIAHNSPDPGLKSLCNALLIQSWFEVAE